MILAVTLNAALDVTYEVDELLPHSSHRVRAHHERAGGKGVNVARVLHQLGHEVVASGLLAGRTGESFRDDLDAAGVAHDFEDLAAGETRRTVTVVDGDATVLNEAGPHVSMHDWERFLDRYAALADTAEIVVLAGSLPPGLEPDAYAELCRLTSAPCLVDATGEALLEAARAGAAVVKCNHAEMRETTGFDEPQAGASALLETGAHAVVVSLGADGMLAARRGGAWRALPPERLAGNPTGAGDAATAALAATHERHWSERLHAAVTWSAAAVPAPVAGALDLPTLDRLRSPVATPEERDATRQHG